MEKEVPVLSLEIGEVGLLMVMWISTAYMFIESYSFTGLDGLYPRLFSFVVLLMCTLLIVRNLLPDMLYNIVEGEGVSFGDSDDILNEDSVKEDEAKFANDEQGMTNKSGFVLVLTTMYVIVGYLIGLMWATPLYVFSYLWWTDYSLRISGGLASVMFVIAYILQSEFNFPIEQGYLQDMIFIVMEGI